MSTTDEPQINLDKVEEILLAHAHEVISNGTPDKVIGVVLLKSPRSNLPIPEIKSRFSSLMTRLQPKNSRPYSDNSDMWFIATALSQQDLNNILATNIPQQNQFTLFFDIPPEIQAWFDEIKLSTTI